MKPIKYFQNTWRLAALLALLLAVSGVLAQEYNRPAQQPDRILLIFETSPVLKKNLSGLKQVLASLFSSNLQNELHSGDDLAVWTLDKTLHTGTFEMESWSPDEAEDYTDRLSEFLKHQDFTRHASLAPLEPLLDHVVKGSDHLTVLIFCDAESQLTGTPYDDGVNEIMTNAAARLKSGKTPYIVVLRAYHGEYIGCSVNRSAPLNFPKFPVAPKLAPPPAPKPAPVVASAPASGPAVTPVSAMIIVGTNASTHVAALTQPPSAPVVAQAAPPAPATAPAPEATPQTAPNTTVAPAPAPTPTAPQSIILTGPPPAPVQPTPQQPAPAPTPEVPPPTPAPAVASTPAPTSSQPDVSPSSNAMAASPANTPSEKTDAGFLVPLVIAGGALAAAVVIIVWLMARSRRPQGSLITSSMQDDPRLGPKK